MSAIDVERLSGWAAQGSSPAPDAVRVHVGRALRRYGVDVPAVHGLRVAQMPFPSKLGPLELATIDMPEWAAHCAVNGVLAVPVETAAARRGATWRDVDWYLAAFLLLECWHERQWEAEHGPIHSYSLRLKGWDERVWSRAWVNRIALFLRAWAAQAAGADEVSLLGPRPTADVLMTHDVDAVGKTLSIRCKQSLFLAFNAGRLAGRGQWTQAMARAGQAMGFLFGRDDWSRVVTSLCELEIARGLRSRFHYYAGGRPSSLTRWLFDPGYSLSDAAVSQAIRAMPAQGFSVGLHPSHGAWRSAATIQAQRERLEAAAGGPVTACRQHWLRFSWRDTWTAQTQAGLTEDSTLMFNDRPGFRSAAALAWSPWDAPSAAPHRLTAMPTVLMDSHLYDYQPLSAEERRRSIAYWLDEVEAVGGQAAVLWHPHTLTRDYGWRDGFIELLDHMNRRNLCSAS